MTREYIDMLEQNDMFKKILEPMHPWGEMEYKDGRGNTYQILGSEDNPIIIDFGKIEVKLVRRNQEEDKNA